MVSARKFLEVVVICLAAALPLQASAQLAAKAQAGIVAARGNTETDSANAKFEIEREFETWKPQASLAGVYASEETGATGQRWDARGQLDYKFHEKGFSFLSARYEEDRFSGFEYQATYGMGFGWRFYDDMTTKLITQIGAGYKTLQSRDAISDDGLTFIPGEREEDLVLQSTVDFKHELTETTQILNKVLVEHGEDNTFAQNDLSLQVKIMSSLALALGYSVRYNTEPPPGFETMDTLTTVNLVYELK
jgi:putative salt-induced outer membrane protein